VEHVAPGEAHVKKKTLIALEQARPDVVQARANFFAEQLKDVALQDVAVLDESFATTTFTRLRGRCPRHQRLKASVPAGHWKRLTILAAITVAGVLAAGVIDAATDAEVFRGFIDHVLVPALRPGMVVVMDNLSSHKVSGIVESIQAAGCRVVYLPPYSPDLSPIEPTWSKVKQLIRTQEPREVGTLVESIGMALSQITAADCQGCFRDCGYETLRLI
jgi:transposase